MCLTVKDAAGLAFDLGLNTCFWRFPPCAQDATGLVFKFGKISADKQSVKLRVCRETKTIRCSESRLLLCD